MSYHSYLEIYNLKKELEVYKKAFEMACNEIHEHSINPYCGLVPISIRGSEGIKEFLLMEAKIELKAREQE